MAISAVEATAIITLAALAMTSLVAMAVRAIVVYRRGQDLRARYNAVVAAQVLLGEPDRSLGAGLPQPADFIRTGSGYRYAKAALDTELAALNLALSNQSASAGALGPDEDPKPFSPRDWA